MQMSCNWISFKFPIFWFRRIFFSTCAPTHEDSGESNYRGECRVCHGPHGMSSGRSAHQVPPVGLGDFFVNLTFRIVSGWWVHRGRNHPTWRMMRATLQRHIERWRLSLFFFPAFKGAGLFWMAAKWVFFFFSKSGTYERLMMFHLHHADQFQLAADVRQCLERSLCKFVHSSGQFCWKMIAALLFGLCERNKNRSIALEKLFIESFGAEMIRWNVWPQIRGKVAVALWPEVVSGKLR